MSKMTIIITKLVMIIQCSFIYTIIHSLCNNIPTYLTGKFENCTPEIRPRYAKFTSKYIRASIQTFQTGPHINSVQKWFILKYILYTEICTAHSLPSMVIPKLHLRPKVSKHTILHSPCSRPFLEHARCTPPPPPPLL